MIYCFPLFTTHFCFNTAEGMKRKKISAFGIWQYVSLTPWESCVDTIKNSSPSWKSSYCSLFVFSNFQLFPESQFGDGKSAVCWKMLFFPKSLLSYKQGTNVGVWSHLEDPWEAFFTGSFSSPHEKEEFWEGRYASCGFPLTAPSQAIATKLLVSGPMQERGHKPCGELSRGAFCGQTSLGMEGPLN